MHETPHARTRATLQRITDPASEAIRLLARQLGAHHARATSALWRRCSMTAAIEGIDQDGSNPLGAHTFTSPVGHNISGPHPHGVTPKATHQRLSRGCIPPSCSVVGGSRRRGHRPSLAPRPDRCADWPSCLAAPLTVLTGRRGSQWFRATTQRACAAWCPSLPREPRALRSARAWPRTP